MTSQIAGLDGCTRCPSCYKVPTVKFENERFVLLCEIHGHMAIGDTLESAVANWNIYIDLSNKVA